VLRALLPQRVYTAEELFDWLLGTQARNERAKRSHLNRRRQRWRDSTPAGGFWAGTLRPPMLCGGAIRRLVS
jgi:hypothetical protein